MLEHEDRSIFLQDRDKYKFCNYCFARLMHQICMGIDIL
jgi:hypothetical protein